MTAPRRDLEARTLNLYVAGDDGDALVVNAGGVDVFTVDSDGALTVTGPVATGGALTAYTPDTGITLGTGGTITGAYQVIGDMMDLYVAVDLGTSFSLPATPSIDLPRGWVTSAPTFLNGWYLDSGVPGPLIAYADVYAATLPLYSTAGAKIAATVPITWTASDFIYLAGRFQAEPGL